MEMEIQTFFHCANCMPDRPEGVTPKEWVRIQAGWTEKGLQVWCNRCDLNVVHLDFHGTKAGVIQ
jgi:hypothetical protein